MNLTKDFIEKPEDAYERFNYYFLTHNGVYIYPEYTKDLRAILNYVDITLDEYFMDDDD